MQEIKIIELEKEIYCRYANQTEPQNMYIELDTRTGEVSASYDAEIGGGEPIDVRKGVIRRYTLPWPYVRKEAINRIMKEMKTLFKRVLEAYHSPMPEDGNDYNLIEADSHIERYIGNFIEPDEDLLHIWNPANYFDAVKDDIDSAIKKGASEKDIFETFVEEGTVDIFEPSLEEYLENRSSSLA
jgi:hypothetical protein